MGWDDSRESVGSRYRNPIGGSVFRTGADAACNQGPGQLADWTVGLVDAMPTPVNSRVLLRVHEVVANHMADEEMSIFNPTHVTLGNMNA